MLRDDNMILDDTDPPLEAARSPALWTRVVPVGVVLVLLAVGYLRGYHEFFSLAHIAAHRDHLLAFVAAHGVGAALAYIVVYIVAVAISFPGASILTIAGGLMFGWLAAGTLTVFAATVGASIIFLIARTAFGDILKSRAGPRIAILQDGFQENAFSYLLSIRLIPVFPFWLVNLAPAFFGMKLIPYVVATAIGIIPGTFAYAYFGQSLRSAIGDSGPVVSTELLAGFAVLGLATLIPVVLKRMRRSADAGGKEREQD